MYALYFIRLSRYVTRANRREDEELQQADSIQGRAKRVCIVRERCRVDLESISLLPIYATVNVNGLFFANMVRSVYTTFKTAT